ncbi:MAG: hypothetical protein F6J94_02585 [Moorea sp. SIO1F2]|uniref:hypothetical protein n=1 Tax=Moorena sp. SIO1F2 TaxID=2607819 RepID=UPI0013BC7F15|nr:hypothetical protein [Moorena sp. SIO1F2]NET80901.1 hypothetical protein [Moorena sp. SIO1F2]
MPVPRPKISMKLARCQFHARCPFHRSHRSRLPTPDSLLPTPYSLLPTPCSLCSMLRIPSTEC